MVTRDSSRGVDSEALPFGAIDADGEDSGASKKKRSSKKKAAKKAAKKKTASKKASSKKASSKKASAKKSLASGGAEEPEAQTPSKPAESAASSTGRTRKKVRTRTRTKPDGEASEPAQAAAPPEDKPDSEAGAEPARGRRRRRRESEAGSDSEAAAAESDGQGDGEGEGGGRRRRRRRSRRRELDSREARGNFRPDAPRPDNQRSGQVGRGRRGKDRPARGGNQRSQEPVVQKKKERTTGECEGLLVIDKGGHGKLRDRARQFLPNRAEDVHLSPRMIQKHGLREGALVRGRFGKGMGKHKFDLIEVSEIDGRPPGQVRNLPVFKKLTSIDPDFHYELGDLSDDTSLRVVDLICPIGRGQRGLIVAPPRSGKTILLQKLARGIEEHYPDVHLMVLLVDERPEEATEWRRSTGGEVFCSTNDELPKTHVELSEVVWKRCQRLVELGEDVVLLLDSITRMARAYNNVHGTSGKTMSGGLDTRAMERPKQFFGSARNTETAGSLTILGTTLIETGSQMDKVIFEEFKGTGNMELVLSRKLADRRIFPAIDIERSGTRKEEKLITSQRLRRIITLRRVLSRMNFIEAMELLSVKLDDVERNDDFLKRFDVDPEA